MCSKSSQKQMDDAATVNDTLAVITLDSNQKRIRKIELTQTRVRFKCKRGAKLCCKLGGPALTRKDVGKIEEAGYSIEEFLEPSNNSSTHTVGCLKKRKDGSCVFLKFDAQQKRHKCSIYSARPTLCRVYPFKLEQLDAERFVLKVIPCCLGLNNPEGETVNENFVESLLEDIELF